MKRKVSKDQKQQLFDTAKWQRKLECSLLQAQYAWYEPCRPCLYWEILGLTENLICPRSEEEEKIIFTSFDRRSLQTTEKQNTPPSAEISLLVL